MKKLLIAAAMAAACFTASACADVPLEASSGGTISTEVAVAGVERTEAQVRGGCPRNQIELALLVGLRLGFDDTAGKRLSPAQRTRVDAARAATNQVCGIVVEAPPPAPPPAPETIDPADFTACVPPPGLAGRPIETLSASEYEALTCGEFICDDDPGRCRRAAHAAATDRRRLCSGPVVAISDDDPGLALFRGNGESLEDRKVRLTIERINSCDRP